MEGDNLVPPEITIENGSDNKSNEESASQPKGTGSQYSDEISENNKQGDLGVSGNETDKSQRKKKQYKPRAKSPSVLEVIAELPNMLNNMRELYNSLKKSGLLLPDSWQQETTRPVLGNELKPMSKVTERPTAFYEADNQYRLEYANTDFTARPPQTGRQASGQYPQLSYQERYAPPGRRNERPL